MPRRENRIDSYYKVKLENASPMGLIYILYEGAIKDLEDCKVAFKRRNRSLYSEKLIHAQDCIRTLRNSLNLEVGEIAKNLYSLYSYCINLLIEANLTRENPDAYIEQVLKIIRELNETWHTAEKEFKKTKQKTIDQNNTGTGYQPLSVTG